MAIAISTGALRLLASLLGLLILGCWEMARPFKPLIELRLRHYLKNLFFGATNSLILNITVSSFVVAYFHYLDEHNTGLLHMLSVGPKINVVLSFIFLDFVTYVWHKAYHETPFMWRLHKVHHSDLDLDVTSASRFHLGEILLSTALKMFIGLFWGPNALAMAIHEAGLLAAAQFQHANIGLPEPLESWVKKILVTPDMHRVHHSNIPTHTNSNYSNLFSFWDKLFGTYTTPIDQKTLTIGLKEYPTLKTVTLPKLLVMPFV